jgi:hypothetical protein
MNEECRSAICAYYFKWLIKSARNICLLSGEWFLLRLIYLINMKSKNGMRQAVPFDVLTCSWSKCHRNVAPDVPARGAYGKSRMEATL